MMSTLQAFVVVSLFFGGMFPGAIQAAYGEPESTISIFSDLRVKIVDPQSAVVPGAEVVLLREGRGAPISVLAASATGQLSFRGLEPGKYSIRVLAAGFGVKEENLSIPQSEEVTVQLEVVSAVETVTVTAAGVPVPAEDSGAQVSALNASQLEGMQSVAAADALRFLPGAVVSTAGRRGGQSSLFVRGGDSRYNKVIVDGVPIDDPGGFFDFGVVPIAGAERIELARGAQSTLYGSEAMTSVVQVFTREGSTRVPELRLGADGGTFGTARGYASLAGARGPFDYDLFGQQATSNGQGVNDVYSSSSQGANVGVALNSRTSFRLRTRHANSFTGVPGEWNFGGKPVLPPDSDQYARQNQFLASAELSVAAPSGWQHRFSGYEYNNKRLNVDNVADRGCDVNTGNFFDCPFRNLEKINRAGFNYQGEYWARSWARSTFGYEFEDENATIQNEVVNGLRLNHALYGQEILTLGRVGLVGGARYVHNQTFGNKVVPRLGASLVVRHGGAIVSGTRLRFAYATGIRAPAFDESFATAFTRANLNLRAEENRSIETGLQQGFWGGKYSVSANFFQNNFRRQIAFTCCDAKFLGQFVNLNRSLARGAEFELHAQLKNRLSMEAAYTNLSTKILDAPDAGPPFLPGEPLLRRPKHSGSLLLNYVGSRWGGNVGGSFVGRRPDSDFLFFPQGPLGINHAAGYARVDVGGWYQVHRRITAYVNVENALNKHYEEVVGYPALRANFRAGLRFRIGGE